MHRRILFVRGIIFSRLLLVVVAFITVVAATLGLCQKLHLLLQLALICLVIRSQLLRLLVAVLLLLLFGGCVFDPSFLMPLAILSALPLLPVILGIAAAFYYGFGA